MKAPTDESTVKIQVLQLASRLEDASSNERLDAIQSLHSLARHQARLVGEYSLSKLLEILREHGSVEEYQDVLDLINRLITSKDTSASSANALFLLSENRNIDLLLDLLEHDDMTIGVITSQILTEIHALHGPRLESEIQQCPDGMSKLLKRLQDPSREEVRDQAIVFVKQLTRSNEEMKKNFVFNEGFDIVFRVIRSELDRSGEITTVVQDCLLICNHVLSGSEICQRLFYDMSQHLVNELKKFFDPSTLESYKPPPTEEDADDSTPIEKLWFNDTKILLSSILALGSLSASLSTPNIKHQSYYIQQSMTQNLSSNRSILSSAAYWLVRRGPSPLLNKSFEFITNVIRSNPDAARYIFTFVIHHSGLNLPGKNIPSNADIPSLSFGWKPFKSEDIRYILLPSLLAERYIYSGTAWSSATASQIPSNIVTAIKTENSINSHLESSSADGLSSLCLATFETWLEADSTLGDLIIQYILAPPPPLPEEFDESGNITQEISKPLGVTLFTLLLDGCHKLLNMTGVSAMNNQEIEIIERTANILSVIFIHGTSLGKELSTAIITSHIPLSQTISSPTTSRSQPLLQYILIVAGRLMKGSNNATNLIVITLLRLLASIAANCEHVTKQLFEDPSNLFVLDLASINSENAGVSPLIQIASCFLLGCCYQSLSCDIDSNHSNDLLTPKAFLGMIDSRVGLQRFTNILKRPLQRVMASDNPTAMSRDSSSPISFTFYSASFHKFYESQVELIRKELFNYFTGGVGKAVDPSQGNQTIDPEVVSSYEQLISLQKMKIEELEGQIDHLTASNGSVSRLSDGKRDYDIQAIYQLEDDLSKANKVIEELKGTITGHEKDYESLEALMKSQAEHIDRLEANMMTDPRASSASNAMTAIESKPSISHESDEMVTQLKQQILDLIEEKRKFQDVIVQKDKKIAILETESMTLSSQQSTANKRINELEERNSQQLQQLWTYESDIKEYQQKLSDMEENQSKAEEKVSSIQLIEFESSTGYVQLLKSIEDLTKMSYVFQIRYNQDSPPSMDNNDSLSSFSLEKYMRANTLSMDHDFMSLAEYIDECVVNMKDALSDMSNKCSDVVEGMMNQYNSLTNELPNHTMSYGYQGPIVFQSEEQSFDRINECITTLHDFYETMTEGLKDYENQIRDILSEKDSLIRMNERLEEDMKIVMNNSSTTETIDKELMAGKEMEIQQLRDELERLQEVFAKAQQDNEMSQEALLKDVETLRLQIKELEAEKEGINETKQSLVQTNEEKETLIEKYRQDIHQYEKEMNQIRSEYDEIVSEYKSQIESMANDVNSKKNELQTEQLRGKSMEEQMNRLMVDIQSFNELMSGHDQEKASLRQVIDERDSKIVRYDEKIKSNEDLIDDLRGRITSLETVLATRKKDESMEEIMRNMEDKLHQNELEVNQYKQLNETRSLELSQFKEENQSLQNQLNESKGVTKELENQLKELNEKKESELTQMNELIESKEVECNDLRQEIQSLHNQLNESNRMVKGLENQWKSSQEEIVRLNDEKGSLESSIESLKKDLASYQQRVTNIETNHEEDIKRMKLDHQQAMDSLKQSYEKIIEELNDEMESIQGKYHQQSDEINENMNKTITSLKLDLQEKENQLQDTMNRYELLEEECNDFKLKYQTLCERNSLQEQEVITYKNEFNEKYQQILIEYEEYRLKYNEEAIQNMKHEYEQQHENFVQEMMLSSNEDNQESMMLLKQQYESSLTENIQQKHVIDSLKGTINQLKMDLNTLENQLIAKQQELLTYNSSNDTDEVLALRHENESLIKSNHELLKQFQAMESQVKVKQNFIDGLKNQLQNEKVKVSNMEDQIANLQEDNGALKAIQLDIMSLDSWFYETYGLEVPIAKNIDSINLGKVIQQGIINLIQRYQNNVQKLESKIELLEKMQSNMTMTPIKPSSKAYDVPMTPPQSLGNTRNGLGNTNDVQYSLASSGGGMKISTGKYSATKKSDGGVLTPTTKQLGKLQSEVFKERKKLMALQEEHNDLLGLLAQQELELQIFRDSLEHNAGVQFVLTADLQVEQQALERYGAYINFRRGDYDMDGNEGLFDDENDGYYDEVVAEDIASSGQYKYIRRDDRDVVGVDSNYGLHHH